VTTTIVERLPIPMHEEVPEAAEIVDIAMELGIVRLNANATRASGASGVASGFSRPSLIARLNALVAGRYQLTEAEFRHVLGTFPLVPLEVREAALREFQNRRV
jgi:hypothetical protein